MTKATTQRSPLESIPAAPVSLTRLLVTGGEVKSQRVVLAALAGDVDSAESFLRLASQTLPGRRLTNPGEAVPLLGDTVSTRLAILASGAEWLRRIVRDDPLVAPLLRHSVATAVASEALGRDSGTVSPLQAYAVGLLHHLGDAYLLTKDFRVEGDGMRPHDIAAQLLRSNGSDEGMVRALLEYGAASLDDRISLSIDARILAAADHAVTKFGYAAPSSCGMPAVADRVSELISSLLASSRRVTRSIEDVVGGVVGPRAPNAPAESAMGNVTRLSPVLMPEIMDGMSSRDLGPLPVLFSRITGSADTESIVAALTAGLVDDMGVSRAYFLNVDDNALVHGGVLCGRGTVPLPLDDFLLHIDRLPRPIRTAVMTGRPILHENDALGLEFVNADPEALTLFVPVTAGKEVLGIIGVEVDDTNIVVPDLLAAVAAHAGLALKSVDLKRLSDEAKTDELTGLFNRRGILDTLDQFLGHPRADHADFAIALIDCDHLKKVNDNFGHLMGDEFVRRISEVVKLSLRTSDGLGRYGGDEFLAVLPEANYEQTVRAMERARSEVEHKGLSSEDGLLLSVSVGAVVRGNSDANRETLLKLADSALYRAKEMGRNAVCVIRADDPPEAIAL